MIVQEILEEVVTLPEAAIIATNMGGAWSLGTRTPSEQSPELVRVALNKLRTPSERSPELVRVALNKTSVNSVEPLRTPGAALRSV